MSTQKAPLPTRIYRMLLRILPSDFRGEYGNEMEAVFQQQAEEARQKRGLSALIAIWWMTISDIFRTAPREHWSALSQDVRYALRMMRKEIGFTSAAILILALGIGANTAIFSLVNSVLLHPLPYFDGDKIVVLRQKMPRLGAEDIGFSVMEINDYRRQNHTLSGLVEYHNMTFTLLSTTEAHRVRTGVVSAQFFDFLGIRPLLGRTFVASDDQPGAQPVLVLSYEFWKQVEGGDPNIIGKKYQMNDKTHLVIGVLPAFPQYPDENDVYMPTTSCPARSGEHMIAHRDMRMMNLFGRLKSGQTLEQSSADVLAISRHMAQDDTANYPRDSGFEGSASLLRTDLTKNARATLLILQAAAAFVLLIACANVANLILARTTRRQQELMIRRAMGAGSARLLRQLLTENFILALIAATLGLLFASATLHLLANFALQYTPRAREVALDGRVLAFAIGCATFTTLVVGSIAALHFKQDLSSKLKEGAGSEHSGFIRGLLISVQVTFSFVLLTGAVLLTNSFFQLTSVKPGFVSQNVFVTGINLNGNRFETPAQLASLANRILEKISSLPGVMSVAVSSSFPLDPENLIGGGELPRFQVEGDMRPKIELPAVASSRCASPDYFKTLGIPLVSGRLFTASDDDKRPPVILLNRALATKSFGTRDPVGRRITFDEGKTWITIVGVVGDVKEFGLNQDHAYQVILPMAQATHLGTVLVRTAADPGGMGNMIHRALREVEPLMAITRESTMEQIRADSISSPRTLTYLFGLFALLALLLSAAGLASMLALWVRQRMHEIGIRMALGAAPESILASVIRRGILLVLSGLGLGLICALALAGSLRAFLFQTKPTDAVTYVVVSALLLLTAVIACYLPARRASQVDPCQALRAE